MSDGRTGTGPAPRSDGERSLFQDVDGLRLVPIPEAHQPEYVSGSAFDPDTLRLAAQTHADHRGIADEFRLKPWVALYLLDVWEAAAESAEWHAAQGQNHVTDAKLYEAVTGKEWRDRV